MRKLLDILFKNERLSIFIPIIVSVVVYLLFVLFGTDDDKIRTMIATPVLMIVCFFGVFLIFFVLIKNNLCPKWFIDGFEILAIVVYGIYSIVRFILFLLSGFDDFSLAVCLGTVSIGAIAWAHSLRTT